MEVRVEFFIPGKPQGKDRPRFNSRSGRVYTPSKTSEYERLVRLEFSRACAKKERKIQRFNGAVRVRITAFFHRAKSNKMQEPMLKPDCDNIAKAILDALNGVAYKDDAQVVLCVITKVFAEPGQPEGVFVELTGECLE